MRQGLYFEDSQTTGGARLNFAVALGQLGAVAAIMTWTAGARGPDAWQNATWARDQCV